MTQPTVAEIVRKVQRIKLVANRSVNDLLAGHYRSVFRGQGMEFDEVREYQPGDEIRSIDWNVTARTGTPFIKRYSEEREMTVMILLDISASGMFGSGPQSKLDVMIELIAVLMFSALKNHDKVGLLLFGSEVVRYLPPRKGRSNVLRLLREMLAVDPQAQRASLDAALQFLNRVQKRKSVVFLVSDFQEAETSEAMAITKMRHDLVVISVHDPRERQLPAGGFVRLRDAETGRLIELDTSSPTVRRWYEKNAAEREERLRSKLKRLGIDQLDINTCESYAKTLRRFFEARERRFR